MKLSLLVSVWRRDKLLGEFFDRWFKQPEIDEVLVWDNSSGKLNIPKDPRIKVFTSPLNYGCTARNVLAHFAINDNVIIACDDVFVEEGFVEDILKYYSEDMFLGIWGRRFNGEKLYGATKTVISKNIHIPLEVEFVVGLISLINRKYLLGLNYRDMKWTCDDMHINAELQEKYPQVKRVVVPSRKWDLTEEETDGNALFSHPNAGTEKQELYEKCFVKST